jgi:hypothetical protein
MQPDAAMIMHVVVGTPGTEHNRHHLCMQLSQQSQNACLRGLPARWRDNQRFT